MTVLFSDLVASTALGERLDSEALREVMSMYFAAVKEAIERHGGTLEKYIGDAVMAVFGLPRSHEDDALRAIRAAVEVAAAPSRLNPGLERQWGISLANRTGVNTGEVTAGDPATGLRLATGDVVNTAARLEQAAPPGGVLLGSSTYRLVREFAQVERTAPLAVKGKSEPLTAYLILGVTDIDAEHERRLDAPMVGRVPELTTLREELDRARKERRCHQVLVLGAAGVGKSRLVSEFLKGIGAASMVLRGRCLSYGEGITYWPVKEAVRSLVQHHLEPTTVLRELLGDETDAEPVTNRLTALGGFSDETYPSVDVAWAFRRLLESLASTGPLIVVFDDVHWAEPTFLDLLDHVREYARAPVLLICVARPELSDQRPAWGSSERCRAVHVEPLADEESADLIGNLLRRVPIVASASQRVITAAGGNPLFVEELIGWLLDQGLIRRDDGRWVAAADLETLPIPPTISALLAARLDSLLLDQRLILERGAVIGQVFYRGALAELCPASVRDFIPDCLTQLTRTDFIQPEPGGTPEALPAALAAFRFRHILIRDAAYDGMLKRTRAELHEAFVGWLERAAGERLMEFDEIVGYHLERASRLLSELAPADDHAARLATRAAEVLARAGNRAIQREDYPAATSLIDRAISLQQDDAARVQLLIDLSNVVGESGDATRAMDLARDAQNLAAEHGDPLLQAQAQLGWIAFDARSGGKAIRTLREQADQLLPILESNGDDRSICDVLYLAALDAFSTLRMGDSIEPLRKAAQIAETIGDVHRWERLVSRMAEAVAAGPTRAEEAVAICRDVLERMDSSRFGAAGVRAALGFSLALLGELDEARMLTRSSAAMLDELGQSTAAASQRQVTGEVELLAGDPAAAEQELRPSIGVLSAAGNRWSLPSNAARLACAVAEQGRGEEARVFVQMARDLAVPGDIDALSWAFAAEALALRDDDRLEDAVAVCEEAVALLEPTDQLVAQGYALQNLAEVLHFAGRNEEAEAAAERALNRYQRKGAILLVGRTKGFLASIQSNP